jgi:hypothetical protein
MDSVKSGNQEIEEKPLNTVSTQQSNVKTPGVRPAAARYSPMQHETKDVLKQLHKNIRQLETLSGQLEFVLIEVQTLVRR